MYYTVSGGVNNLNKIENVFLSKELDTEFDTLRNWVFIIRYNPHLRFKFEYEQGEIVYIPIEELKQEIQNLQ